MKKQKKILLILFFIIFLFSNTFVCASNLSSSQLKSLDYSEEFLNWLALSEEERQHTLQPKVYDLPDTKKESSNPFSFSKRLKASLNPTYNLKNVISNNLVIRDQQQTNACWAFASLSSLETNLAMLDLKKGSSSKVYDFSERHMEYASSRFFANNVENPSGYNRRAGSGGGWYLSASYLTNGTGAILESSMPFENNENVIDISEIRNKTVSSQVFDTKDFPTTNSAQNKMAIKEHVQNYGSVYAGIYGASLSDSTCYNADTGAIYCNNSDTYPINHAVSIIGWDDNYSVNNFNENCRPSSNGAWIIRNSWGDFLEYDLMELKEQLFITYDQQFVAAGITSPALIPNEFIEKLGYTIQADKVIKEIGDKGIMYVSYEDENIYRSLYGVTKSSDHVDYETIYQYDEYSSLGSLVAYTPQIMLGNIFDKKTNSSEFLTQVAIYANETYTCKVYVNPNGSSMAKKDLQFVKLKEGDSETFDAGYHTLEFLTPIEITSDRFAVVIEIQGTRDSIIIPLESKMKNLPTLDVVKIESGKCFIALSHNLDNCEWLDLSKLSQADSSIPSGDSTIKAFTVSQVEDNSLKNIVITTPPTKTSYFEGENFDSKGMVVTANYNNGKSSVITDYTIENGSSLQPNQSSITISYEGKTTTQPITVKKNEITQLTITTPPTKTSYIAGQNFDPKGMVITATFKNGTTKVITDYTIENGANLKNGQTSIEVRYGDKTVLQPIEVKENLVTSLRITTPPTKLTYVSGQDFDPKGMVITAVYQDQSEVQITNYTIENGTSLSPNQISVMIKFEGKTVEQPIKVEEKQIRSIRVEKLPSKTKYIQSQEELDLTGGTITVIYNDDSTEEIPMTSKQVQVSGFDSEMIGKMPITITYQSKMTSFTVEVIRKEVPVEIPENSNFNGATCEIRKICYYTYSTPSTPEYWLMDVTVKDITIPSPNDSYEYYYSLSPSSSEDSIEDWILLPSSQISNGQLSFTLNTKDIKNYHELPDSSPFYLYIKEVAKKGGNQSVVISKPMKMDSNVTLETYLDDKKVTPPASTDSNSTGNSSQNNSSTKDTTVAPTQLPKTGVRNVLILIAIVLVCGIILFIRYKYLSKYIKD